TTSPASTQPFSFQVTGGPASYNSGTFTLTNGQSMTFPSATTFFFPGSYTVLELYTFPTGTPTQPAAGWTLTSSVVTPSTISSSSTTSTTPPGSGSSITLSAGQTATDAFTNTFTSGTSVTTAIELNGT